MVSANTRTEAANPLASLTHSPSSSSSKTNSFAQQLAGAIKSDIHPALEAAGQNPGERHNLVVTKTVASTAATKATTSSAAEIPTMLGMGPVASVASARGTAGLTGTKAVTTTPTKVPVAQSTVPQPVTSPDETEADAYWAQQPAAVQVLRGMPDDNAKEKLALSLANHGYSIDTQIMVWNWDPQMTMQVRENQGYSWVPSFGQSNIPIGPGLSMPGEPNSYSPNSPPAGSIQVSTAFAVGTIRNPLVQVDPAST